MCVWEKCDAKHFSFTSTCFLVTCTNNRSFVNISDWCIFLSYHWALASGYTSDTTEWSTAVPILHIETNALMASLSGVQDYMRSVTFTCFVCMQEFLLQS